MTLEECRNNIGRKVVYTPFEGCDTSLLEYGVIVSANLTYVFVRYGSDINAKATKPEDLTLEYNH